MKFGMVNKSTTVNRFVLHTLQRNITHLAVITRKTNIKLGILKGGSWKRAVLAFELLISDIWAGSFREGKSFKAANKVAANKAATDAIKLPILGNIPNVSSNEQFICDLVSKKADS